MNTDPIGGAVGLNFEGGQEASAAAVDPRTGQSMLDTPVATTDLVSAALLLQREDFIAQRRHACAQRDAERREHARQASEALEAREAQVAAQKEAATLGFFVACGQAMAAAAGASGQAIGAGVLMVEKWDEAEGPSADARNAGFQADRAETYGELAQAEAEDAGERADELRRLEHRVLEILEDIQDGQSRNESTALRA